MSEWSEIIPRADSLYRIAWRSKVTGATGGGSRYLPHDSAAGIATALNGLWPDLHHWIEPEDESRLS